MTQPQNQLKLRRRRVRAAIVTGSRYLEEAIGTLARGGVRRILVVGSSSAHDGVDITAADSLAAALGAVPDDEDVLFIDANEACAGWLGDLLGETRGNVLVVQPRLAHQLSDASLRFVLEPVDVPWFSRRVIAVGFDVGSMQCHGEVLAAGILCRETVAAARDLVAGDPSIRLVEHLGSLIAAGHDVWVHAVPAPAWELCAQTETRAAG